MQMVCIIDNAKVSDHHTIIPTKEISNKDLDVLPTGERNILYLIGTRLLTAVGEKHIFAQTEVVLDCDEHIFLLEGKLLWKMVGKK